MATDFFFNGKVIRQPGAYATIVAGERNAPVKLDYGRVLVIDTGTGLGWGGGAGVSGQLATGKDSIYRFDNIEDYHFFLKGGPFWPMANGLFRPDPRTAAVGASEVLHARAATTECATMTFTAVGGGSNGGTFAFRTRDEGFSANGELNETRARATVTISDPGDENDTITVTIGGNIVGSITTPAGSPTVTDEAVLLNESITATGLSSVISQDGGELVITALANYGSSANGDTVSVSVTGNAVASATTLANGVDGTDLAKGYAYTFSAGIVNTSAWVMEIYVGTFTGLHTDGIAYNELSSAIAEPQLVAKSPEFTNIQTLIDWGVTDLTFGKYFEALTSNTTVGTGVVDATDIGTLGEYSFATGGTEIFSAANLQLVLDSVVDELFTFILFTEVDLAMASNSNFTTIANWIINDSKYERMMFVPLGSEQSEFEASLSAAAAIDRDYVVAVYGEVGFATQAVSSGFRYYDSLVHSGYVLGRTAGRPPQVPVTNKTLGIDTLSHNLLSREKDRALDAGLLVSYLNPFLNRFVVLQGISTLQDNKVIFNNQGQSFQISFKRIIAQINAELVVNAEIGLLNDENGVNANTLANGMIKNFTETYLESRLAKPDLDNLILDYRDVTVRKVNDVCLVNYALVVNNEINKIFFTGFLFS